MSKAPSRLVATLLCVAGVLVGAACAGNPSPVKADVPPAWLDRVPGSNEELCAVGVSGPTYYPQDALAQSKAQAMTELSRAVEVTVKSAMTVRQQGDSLGRSETSVHEMSSLTGEAVVRLAQVRGQWVNPGGYPGRGEKGTVYTLACMPLRGEAP